MERGQSKTVTGNEHLERYDFIIEKQKADLQRIEETKRHKEQQISFAEQELKQVKSEIRTDKLKSVATDAATAIASGGGSLFGSGKLKELEQANGKLQGEIDKRDNQIRLLNEHMRMQEERHSTEKHCQQEIHRQELNMKMKKIEELNEIIGKAFKWFPIMREMLQMEKFCKSAGFTQEMIDVLLAKRKPIVCSGKLYSTQHRQSFKIKDAGCKIEDDLTEEH